MWRFFQDVVRSDVKDGHMATLLFADATQKLLRMDATEAGERCFGANSGSSVSRKSIKRHALCREVSLEP